jgi:ankyrin repeat protein
MGNLFCSIDALEAANGPSCSAAELAVPLGKLCEAGNLELVRRRLKIPGTRRDELYGNLTPLMWACHNNHYDIAVALCDSTELDPCNVGHTDATGQTALMYACEYTDIALAILKTGRAKPEQANSRGDTALIFACSHVPKVALAILKTGQAKPDHVGFRGNTALIFACSNGLSDLALAILATGQGNPDRVNTSGNTALLYACVYGMSDVALALIATDQSKPEHTNESNNTALIYACRYCREEVALAILSTGHGNPDHIADNTGDTALICAVAAWNITTALKIMEIAPLSGRPAHMNALGQNALTYAHPYNRNRSMTKVISELNRAISIYSTQSLAPSRHLAQMALQTAVAAGDICPVTHEPYADCTSVAVNTCGHMISTEYGSLDKCPMCRTKWNAIVVAR